MQLNRGARDGFTLAEFMVASVIFMIVSLAFTSALISALKTNVMANDHYKSTCVARNRIQRAKCVAFNSIGLLVEDRTQVDVYGNQSTTGTFFRTTTITNITSKQIKLTVDVYFMEPNSGRTSAMPVTIETKISDGM
jgi:hypothetical protein